MANETLDFVIDLVEGLIQEEGFKTLRFSDTKNLSTTGYDCLIFKGHDGKEYSIDFSESVTRDDKDYRFESTKYIQG